MAKVNLTESDLKCIIKEAVLKQLNEQENEDVMSKMDRLYKELGDEIQNVHLYADGDDRYLPDALRDAEYKCKQLLVNLTTEWPEAIRQFFERYNQSRK